MSLDGEVRYLILGGGPAGLTVANILKNNGINDFYVLEKENECGGLCRSADVDGAPLDIGGGHFLDVRRPRVNEFLFGFMPKSEWNMFERDSRIDINGEIINHPIEANIWQMSVENQVEYLKSIAAAGCNTGKEMPLDFVSWIYWKLGTKIAENYMIPYNQKMFDDNLNVLGNYWLNKLPNVSFEEVLLSCITKKAYGSQPGHAQFYYPKKFGYGELWRRMATAVKENVLYNKSVCGINFDDNSVYLKDRSSYRGTYIITTIPWAEFSGISGMPLSLAQSVGELKYSSIRVEYHKDNLDTLAQWIYYPNPKLAYHRILVRSNFCTEGRGYWTETNLKRVTSPNPSAFWYDSEYAYPLNTINKPQIMKSLLEWCEKHKVIGLGRWGEHQHYNSDLTVELAMNLAEKLIAN